MTLGDLLVQREQLVAVSRLPYSQQPEAILRIKWRGLPPETQLRVLGQFGCWIDTDSYITDEPKIAYLDDKGFIEIESWPEEIFTFTAFRSDLEGSIDCAKETLDEAIEDGFESLLHDYSVKLFNTLIDNPTMTVAAALHEVL